MRFDGKRQVSADRDALWQSLHDPRVLREIVTGCESMTPLGDGTYAATMVARLGPMTDTYRGTFTIVDLRDGEALRVRVGARGRCGRLDLELGVTLADGARPGTTVLSYVAEAEVGGLVARISGAAMRVFGDQVTGCFFRGLEGAVSAPAPRALVPA